MSDLQLALVALGAVIIIGVVLFNWSQERRIKRDAIKRFDAPADDVLLDDFRIDPEAVAVADKEEVPDIAGQPDDLDAEPMLPVEAEPMAAPAAPPALDDILEAPELPPEEKPQPTPAETLVAFAPPSTLPDSLDRQIDLIALLHLPTPATGAVLRQELPQPGLLDKLVQWLGLDSSGIWHPLSTAEGVDHFGCVACGLQLVDRAGPVSASTLRGFQSKVERLAATLGARLEWLGDADPQQYAGKLDEFCVGVDVMINLHIVQAGSGMFAGTKLRGLAEAGGMKLYDDGKFHLESDSGQTLFVLAAQDRRPFTAEVLRTAFIPGVSLQLDVPRASHCVETFNQMVLLARQLESGLRGTLVDDNQRALSDADIDKIRQPLKALCVRIAEHGITPGSPVALRLFS